jgi:hypothetical protein
LVKWAVAATFAATLVFAGTANAAPPIKRLVWAKATAAYVAQAKAHHTKATCTDWSSSGLRGMECSFGEKGRVTVGYTTTPCVYDVLVLFPANAARNYAHGELNYCKARWWTKPLPAPWTPTTR